MADEKEEISNEEYQEALNSPSYGKSNLQKLIIGLIEAADYSGKETKAQRVKDAMVAITGSHATHGKNTKDDDRILMQVAELLGKQAFWKKNDKLAEGDPRKYPANKMPEGILSATRTELIRQAIESCGLEEPMTSKKATINRIADKLAGKEKQYLMTAVLDDDVASSLEAQILERIAQELKGLGIPFDIKAASKPL